MASSSNDVIINQAGGDAVNIDNRNKQHFIATSTTDRTDAAGSEMYSQSDRYPVLPSSSMMNDNNNQPRSRRIKHLLIIIACIFLVLPLYWAMSYVEPAKSGIDCDHQSFYRHPHKAPFMSTTLFTVLCFLTAFFILIVTEIFMQFEFHDMPHYSHYSLCPSWNVPSWLYYAAKNYVVYIFGIHAVQGAVYLIRKMVAIPRPDFWDVCQPAFPEGRCPPHKTSYDYECQNPEKSKWQNAARSFPSGHVAYAFFTATFCFIYLERRCRQAKRKHDSVRYLIKTIVFWLFAACFASSAERVYYNSHHPSDIYVGALFGIIGAVFVGKLFSFSPERHPQAPGKILPQHHHDPSSNIVG